MKIKLDHINADRKILVDSKYYIDREEESIDYKQLYYNYHQVYLSNNSDSDKTYSQIMEEYKAWKNVLIKPTREHSDPFSVFILEDNMKLYSLKVNAKEYITYYVDNTYKSKLSYEAQEYLDLKAYVISLNTIR